ncbi:MAG: hypothetical protein KKH67_15295, partial [candidate division Zixibacteria bacterium]|nr:hypothetical protein [candidate division Zixibacteria bacterium]MBU1470284.1 hypothetical protein [candidate division Zixibacteria bacterium]
MFLKRLIVFLVIVSMMTAVAWGLNSKTGKQSGPGMSLILDTKTFLWINSIFCVVYNNGNFGYDDAGEFGKTDGWYYPFGSEKDDKTVIYAAGIWVGAKVGSETRVAIGEYASEFVPGPMMDGTFQQDQASFRVYKIGDGSNRDLSPYDDSRDRAEWPVDDGAPVDENGDPALLGNQMCWSVYNDASEEGHSNMQTNPLGVEIQQSTFGFAAKGPLDNVMFMKYTIINKGGNRLDSTFISLWADPDVGDASDDFVGCDTALSLGYAYNDGSDTDYGSSPPAVGFDFFQGPLIPSEGDTAYLPTGPVPNFKQLGMTSFNKYINGTDPLNYTEVYNYMKGLFRDGSPVIDPNTNQVTLFQLPGDPVTGEGWIDEASADRRWMMTTGPFTMEPGDTQVVVAAALAAQGTGALDGVTMLKEIDIAAQVVYDLNFKIPQPPPNPIVYARGLENAVELVWIDNAEGPDNYLEDFRNELNQLYVFEGYNVYMGDSPTGPWTKIATYDYDADQLEGAYAEAAGDYVDCEYDSVSGEWDCSGGTIPRIWDYALLYEDKAKERIISQEGTNSGTVYEYYTDRDPRDGSTIIPYRPHYFAVTSYSVNIQQVAFEDSVFFGPNYAGMLSYNLESKIRGVTVIPSGSGATLARDATRISGASDGYVEVEYLIQEDLTGHDYEVTFNADLSWNLTDLTTSEMLLESQTNQSGDYTYPIVDGFMVRPIGPSPGFKQIDEVYAIEESEWGLDGDQAYMGGRNAGNNANFRDFYVKFLAAPDDTVPGPVINYDGDDYTTIRYLDENGDTIWGYFIGGSAAEEDLYKVSIPFAIYDLGDDFESPDDDVRLWPLFYDFYGDFRWYSDDYFMFLTKDIGGTDANIYGNDFFSYSYHDGDGQYWGYNTADPISRHDWDYRIYGWAPYTVIEGWTKGDSVLFITRKANTPADVFRFSAPKIGEDDGTVIARTMENIKTVPNPYYNFSPYYEL